MTANTASGSEMYMQAWPRITVHMNDLKRLHLQTHIVRAKLVFVISFFKNKTVRRWKSNQGAFLNNLGLRRSVQKRRTKLDLDFWWSSRFSVFSADEQLPVCMNGFEVYTEKHDACVRMAHLVLWQKYCFCILCIRTGWSSLSWASRFEITMIIIWLFYVVGLVFLKFP